MGSTDKEVGQVPASVPASAMAAILNQGQQNQAQYQAALHAAQTPIAGAHAMSLPSAMTRPIPPANQQQLDHRPVVGARAARGQGIANLIRTAGNVIGQAVQQEKQQKQAQLTDAATKMMTAQQLKDEAQQQYDSAAAMQQNATGDEAAQLTKTIDAAKANIDKNDKVIQGITSDPKMRKALAKGLNINYIDPSENKTDEHTAVQAALKNVQGFQAKRAAAEQAKKEYQAKANQQGAQNFGTAFAAAQPQQMGQNQIAQQQVALQQAQFKMLMEYRGKVEPAQIRAQAAIYERQTATNAAIDRQQAQFAHVEHMADVHLANEYKTAMRNAGIQRRLAQQKRADAQGNPLLMFTADRKNALAYEHAAAQKATAIASLQAQHHALYYDSNGEPLPQDKIDPNDVKTLNWQITQLQQAQKNDLDLVKSYSDSADRLQKINGFKDSEAIDESESSASSGTDSSAAKPLSAPGEPDDPDTY